MSKGFPIPCCSVRHPRSQRKRGEKKTESTIFSNLTKSVIGWESLAPIGRQIIICPPSGWPVRNQEEGGTFLRTGKRNVLGCGVCVCVCVYVCVSLWVMAREKRCWKVSSGGEIKKGRQPFVSVSAPCLNLCGRKCRISPNKHTHKGRVWSELRAPGSTPLKYPPTV